MVGDRQCLEDSERKDHLINECMNHEGVYRTAPATLGLLITFYQFKVALSKYFLKQICEWFIVILLDIYFIF